jgi:uncharacterized protein YecE (DUF72 family)
VADVFVGTSGWSYKDWVGSLYPLKTPAARMLHEYAARLSTVEAHNTYRRRPPASLIDGWLAQVPPTFRFAPKAHVAITHQRELTGVEERVREFFGLLEPLGPRLGPVMFQLPHKQPDLERLDRLLGALPDDRLTAFELAEGWRVPEVFDRLNRHGASFVVVDDDDAVADPALIDVGACAYVRLRRPQYADKDLRRWAKRLRAVAAAGRDVYVYLRHEGDPTEAVRLAEAVRG